MNYSIKCKSIESAFNMTKMFEMRKQIEIGIMSGEYRNARNAHRQLAKSAVEDFEAYTSLPHMHYIMPRMSLKETLTLLARSINYRIYSAFTRKTPEEKQLAKQYKEYAKGLTKEDIKKKTIDVVIPSLY